MEEILGGCLVILALFLMFTGLYYWFGTRDSRYAYGYECATQFNKALTRADTLQIQLDGCTLLIDSIGN